MDRFKFLTKLKINNLPKTSGVYSFWEKNKLIYIGKARNIKDRAKNHFNQPSYRDNFFINKVNKIGFIKTNSEIEALILEANLIKKYQPRYNVMWRDDKNYFWVAILQNENRVPYVLITHHPKAGGSPSSARIGGRRASAKLIGPFTEGVALKKTLRFLRRVFPYYTSKKHPKTKCTWCHLDLCPGPVRNLARKRAISNGAGPNPNLDEYKKNIKKLILILKGKRSAVLNSLKKEMKQLSKENKFEEAGKIRDRIYNLQQVMSHTHVINAENQMVGFFTPVKNLTTIPSLKILQKILGTEKIYRIECYDVSNIQGKQATGSMVVFTNGLPCKNQYRKFRIKIEGKPNDIAMLKEILQRRFLHPEWRYPEAILIDGGKAQLNAAISAKNVRLPMSHKTLRDIKMMSLAKRNNELYIEGRKNPILLKTLPREIFNLILQLRDEAHRFAIAYHRKLRKKNLLA